MRRFRHTLYVISVTPKQGIPYLHAPEVTAERIHIGGMTVEEHASCLVYDGHAQSLDVMFPDVVTERPFAEQAVMPQRLHHLVVVHLET